MNIKKAMRIKLACLTIAIISLFGVVSPLSVQAATISDASESKPLVGIVDATSLNVRESASTSSKKVASLFKYDPVMVVGESGDFYKIMYNTNGDIGYVYKTYLYVAESDYYLQANTSGGNLNMRSCGGTSCSIVASVPNKVSFGFFNDFDPEWYVGVYGNVRGFTSREYTSMIAF